MFNIKMVENNVIMLSGRFDAAQEEKALRVLNTINESYVLDLKELNYISSAGLGVLLATQKRLNEAGHRLKLIKMNNHIRDIFRYAGFDMIFDIE